MKLSSWQDDFGNGMTWTTQLNDIDGYTSLVGYGRTEEESRQALFVQVSALATKLLGVMKELSGVKE